MKLSWLSPSPQPISNDELKHVGVVFDHINVHPDDYQPTLDHIKRERGYVHQDIVELTPETTGLTDLCDRFKDGHSHSDDEVRFVLTGSGIFDIRSHDDRWMRVEVEQGDLLIVPANLYHRFFLTPEQTIRCVRLFKSKAGWVPEYRPSIAN